MTATENDPATEVTVVGPAYWADHAVELTNFLRAMANGPTRVIADPSGRSAGQLAVIVNPAYWSAQPRELADAMRRVTDELLGAPATDRRAETRASGAASTEGRLTMTVEEAAAALGISRALAYEAVQHGDIPCIRIGRRILVPRSRLMKMLSDEEREPPGQL